jgi:hypothetical protein
VGTGHQPDDSTFLINALFDADPFVYALLYGLAQGAVFAGFSGRKLVGVAWMAANVLAIVVAPAVPGPVYDALVSRGVPPAQAINFFEIAFGMAYAAVTGLALAAGVGSRMLARGPAPAVRWPPAPTL